MKIAVINSSGNVGKSTITKEFLFPRLDNCLIVEIETVNSSNIQNSNLNIKKYDLNENIENLYFDFMENENIILDVGASNLADFFTKILDFPGFLDIFDYFLIPAISNIKETEDTIKTFQFLKSIEIEKSKIKILPNRVKSDFKNEFTILIKNLKDFHFDDEIFIKESKLFGNLALLQADIKSVYQDNLDFYKEKILQADTPGEKMKYIKMDLSNRMAHKIKSDFDKIFQKMFNVIQPQKQTLEQKETTPKTETKKDEIDIENDTSESEDF